MPRNILRELEDVPPSMPRNILKEQEEESLGHRIVKYVKGDIPNTVPSGIRATLEEVARTIYNPRAIMYGGQGGDPAIKQKTVGFNPAAMFDAAGMAATPGFLKKGLPVAKRSLSGVKRATTLLEKAELKKAEKLPSVIGKAQAPEKLPKYARSVNLERQRIEVEAKLHELELSKGLGPKIRVTNKETIDKASKIVQGWKENPLQYKNRIQELKNGKSLPTAAESVAHRVMNADKQMEFVDLAKKWERGEVPKQVLDDYQNAIKESASFKEVDAQASEAGRLLQSHNILVGRYELFKTMQKLTKSLNEKQLKALNKIDWSDPDSIKMFKDRYIDSPKLQEYLYEAWYNAILSGPPTHVVNFVNNTIWGAFQIPHRVLEGGVDKALNMMTGRERTKFASEAVPMLAGYGPGIKRGAKAAWRVIRGKSIADDIDSKWMKDMGHIAGAFSHSPNEFVRGIGKVITPPTKALRAMDVWAGSIAYSQQAAALARRAALKKGLKGIERKVFEKEWLQNLPNNKVAQKQLSEYRKYAVFTDDPGNIGKAVMYARKKIPGARLVIPFVRTIGNLIKRGVEMTPGVGLSVAKGQNLTDVIAKQISGSIILYTVFDKILKGKITGPMPTDPAERASWYRQNKKPWSIMIGDTWYSYRRAEPFGTVIAFAVNTYNSITNAGDEDTATDMFLNAANEFKNYVIDSSYAQGVAKVLNRYGKLKGAIQRTVASFIPYSSFFRSINRAYEAIMEGKAYVRDDESWFGAFSQTFPGLYKGQPIRLNVWGERESFPGGPVRHIIPFKWAEEKGGILEKSLEELNIYPGLPSKKYTHPVTGKKLQFDDDIYRDFVIKRGRVLKKRLTRLFSNRQITDKNKVYIIKYVKRELNRVSHDFRDIAIRQQLAKNRIKY